MLVGAGVFFFFTLVLARIVRRRRKSRHLGIDVHSRERKQMMIKRDQ